MTRNAIVFVILLATVSLSADEWLSGTWILAERKLDRAIASARGSGDRVAEARLLAKRASLLLDRSSYHRLDSDGARRAIEEARAVAEATGDRAALASSIQALARWHHWRKLSGIGDWETVDATIGEALKIREEIGDEAGLAESWFYRGLVRQFQEDNAAAREAFEKSLRYARDPLARSYGHRHLGYIIQLSGDIDSARKHYAKSLELREQAGAHALVPFAMNLLADFELETTKDRARAKSLLAESARTARCAKSWRALNAAEAKLAELDPARAHVHARRALEAAQKYGDAEMIEEAKKLVASRE
jgi:tetratricopeptide (TPR) repeat protein